MIALPKNWVTSILVVGGLLVVAAQARCAAVAGERARVAVREANVALDSARTLRRRADGLAASVRALGQVAQAERARADSLAEVAATAQRRLAALGPVEVFGDSVVRLRDTAFVTPPAVTEFVRQCSFAAVSCSTALAARTRERDTLTVQRDSLLMMNDFLALSNEELTRAVDSLTRATRARGPLARQPFSCGLGASVGGAVVLLDATLRAGWGGAAGLSCHWWPFR